MRSVGAAMMIVAGLSATVLAQTTPKVVIGDNPSLSGAPLYIALENGYCGAAGIDAQLEMSGTSSDPTIGDPLLAATGSGSFLTERSHHDGSR
jgi:ABC-type nitrate/sulfonate/bicarbonate transport system substrate-binding protein